MCFTKKVEWAIIIFIFPVASRDCHGGGGKSRGHKGGTVTWVLTVHRGPQYLSNCQVGWVPTTNTHVNDAHSIQLSLSLQYTHIYIYILAEERERESFLTGKDTITLQI